MKLRVLATMLTLASMVSGSFGASPYAGQEARDIKALSPEDVGAYLSGKGMGFAKAAELNGFAGPAHVLELAAQLQLTAEQRARTEALFASMTARASRSGKALVERERELDGMFATKSITTERLTSTLKEIGTLMAEVRDAHLEAHLSQVEILTPEQNARYVSLRGYGAQAEQGSSGHKH